MLIEDYPGVGKTALARALARSIDAEYARVQCTADLLPADVVGTNVFNQRENRFEFRPGPVFANVVLVDEINRASPKTQSGLLECMQERHVTVDKHTHELARPVPGGGDPEPGRVRGHLSAARGAARPLHGARLARLPDARERRATMLLDHAERDRVLDLEPVADVAEVAGRAGGRRRRARQRGAAPLRGRDPRGDARRPARRARRQPARGADAVPRRQGATRRSRGATTRCPTTSRRSPTRCSRTACCSRPGPAATSARRWCATRSSGSRPCRRAMRPLAVALLGVALLPGRRRRSTSPSLYVPGRGADRCSPPARSRGCALAAAGRDRARAPGPHTVIEEEPYPLRIEVRTRRAAAARRRAGRAAARLAGADRRGAGRGACASTSASRAAAGACSSPRGW